MKLHYIMDYHLKVSSKDIIGISKTTKEWIDYNHLSKLINIVQILPYREEKKSV